MRGPDYIRHRRRHRLRVVHEQRISGRMSGCLLSSCLLPCQATLDTRVRARLTALNEVQDLRELSMPGWRLHPHQGKPTRFALAVNGPWRITFEWEDGDALNVDLEQYH